MVRLVALVMLGACSFQVRGGSSTQDAPPGDDGAIADDGAVADMAIDDMPPIDARTDWWDPAWTHRRRITLDTSTFPGPVTDFPILIRLPALAGVDATGKDLRFVALDNTAVYPYDLDSFAAVGATAVWVKMTIAQSVDTELWVYYGNSAATPMTSGPMVFGGAHVSVHHMGSLLDATGNAHTASNGTLNAIPSSTLTGRIGAAKTFDGNDDALVLATSDTAYDFTTAMYASAWIRVAGFEDNYQAIITKGDSSWRMARANGGSGVSFGWTSGDNNNNLLGTTAVDDGEWHHVAIVQTATAKSVYVDGTLDEAVASTATLDTNNYQVRFGMNEQAASRYWHGDLDEIRISATSRDAAWIFAEHATTTAGFATVGADEPY